jgi:hypothetical protein
MALGLGLGINKIKSIASGLRVRFQGNGTIVAALDGILRDLSASFVSEGTVTAALETLKLLGVNFSGTGTVTADLASFQGLFDLYPPDVNGAMSSSTILLLSTYTGALARVIAYNGSTQFGAADIMPYEVGSNKQIDLNSTLDNLDATATGRGLTTSSTLSDLLSVGVNDYEGLITKIYPIYGSDIPEQTILSKMPKITSSGGVLNTVNTMPAFEFVAANQTEIGVPITNSQPFTFFIIFKETANLNAGILSFFGSAANGYALYDNGGSTYQSYFGANLGNFATNLTQNIYSAKIDGVSSLVRFNGSETTGNAGAQGMTNYNIGSLTSGFFCSANIQSVVVYFSDQSANIANIEDFLKTAYSMP